LTVCIPTLIGREASLERVVAAYEATAPGCEILTTTEFQSVNPGWGAGCNLLAARASSDLLLLASDDAVPHPGWLEAGLEALERHEVPQARFLHQGVPAHPHYDTASDRKRLGWTRFFLLWRGTVDLVGPFLPGTAYIDLDYSERLEECGWQVVSRDGFCFDHLNAPRDWSTPELDTSQYAALARARASRASRS